MSTKDHLSIKEKILETFKGKEGQLFRPHEIIDRVLQKFPGTNTTSILPADRCYNRINKGIERYFQTEHCLHVFDYSFKDGTYKYIGANNPFYSGKIIWKGKEVGEWENGNIERLEKLE